MSARFIIVTVVALGLAACASLPQVIPTGTDTFDIRYDNLKTSPDQADAAAHQRCPNAQLVSGNIGSDGLSYRSYRCAQPASGS